MHLNKCAVQCQKDFTCMLYMLKLPGVALQARPAA